YVGDSQQEIYAWTGAVNALASIDADHSRTLTQSFRFGPAIAEAANGILDRLPTEIRVRGLESIDSTVAALREDEEADAVLCRTNATALGVVMTAQKQGRRPHLVGGGADLINFARAALALMAGQSTDHSELACFDSWSQVQAYVQQDEQGEDLALSVRL